NFYVYVERAKEMTIGNVSSFTEGNYYVFPISTQVEGKTVEPCKLYTIGKAVQSVTINDVPTETKVWGNAAFDVTVSISPSDATNQTVDWSCTNATVTDNGDGTYSVLITGNTGGKATISATVDGVSSTAAEITVDPDYVDLGTGYVYWKTSDDDPMSGYWAVQKNAPPDYYFNLLWNANLVERSGTKFTNKNGSGASITLQSAHYWTSMVNSSTNAGVYFIVTSDGYTSQQGSRDDVKNVRAVRSQQ
ncbi:MAG: Ig-like domain-containing protein, partial [Bacteroidales bacterium]|nr:Ig-like domain-containing protein [Bacteroidales bacterium]